MPRSMVPLRACGLILATTLAAGATSARERAQGGPSSNDSRVISLLRPQDAGFDAALDSDFAGIRSVQGFQRVEPLLAILHNESTHAVLAYVIKWTITKSDGSTTTASLPVMQDPVGQWVLSGQWTVLKPDETQLVSPFFNWSASQFPGLLHVNAIVIDLQAASLKPLTAEIEGASGVQATLDGAVFDDGFYVGPDTLKLYERYEAEQQGQRDEAQWVQRQLNAGTTADQLASMLSEQVKKGYLSTGTDVPSLYYAARGRQAKRFLADLRGMGLEAARYHALQAAGAKALALRRQGQPVKPRR